MLQLPFEGFGKLRNDVLAQLSGDWVFSLDADERCTEAAAAEIRRIVEQRDAADAYLVPRRNFFFGRWIEHSGWFPDYRQPQPFRRGKLSYTTDAVHETYVLDGRLGRTTEPIAQVPFRDLAQIVHKMQRYSTLGIERLVERAPPRRCGRRWRMASAPFCGTRRARRLPGRLGGVRASFSNFECTFYRYAKHAEGAAVDPRAGLPPSLKR